jgi:hypothetical protein
MDSGRIQRDYVWIISQEVTITLKYNSTLNLMLSWQKPIDLIHYENMLHNCLQMDGPLNDVCWGDDVKSTLTRWINYLVKTCSMDKVSILNWIELSIINCITFFQLNRKWAWIYRTNIFRNVLKILLTNIGHIKDNSQDSPQKYNWSWQFVRLKW